MQAKALKEKLQERLETTETKVDAIVVNEDTNTNVVPFMRSDSQAISVVPSFEISLKEARERIFMLQQFVKEMMIPGQDYGVIPKCDKPTLFKSDGEKLCDIFGFSKKIEVVNRIEDWKDGIFHYEVKATLISKRTGLVEAEGIGSCNSKEKKYSAQHPYSIVNSLLKMAKKRAFIDAVLSATRSSGLFSQDLEDFEDLQAPKQENSTPANSGSDHKSTDLANMTKPVTKSQLNKIQALVAEKTIPINRIKATIKERYKVAESKSLTLKQADDFIKYLMSYKVY